MSRRKSFPGQSGIVSRSLRLCAAVAVCLALAAMPAVADPCIVVDNGTGTIDLPDEGLTLKEVEKDLISQAINKADGNQTKAAKLLGISRDALRYKMQKFHLL